jgi:hypothetical protein
MKLRSQMWSAKSQELPSEYDPHYAWFGFRRVISSTFPHTTLCLSPMLEGALS